MKKEVGFSSSESSSNVSIRYASIEENPNKKSVNAVEFLENLYLSFVKTVDIKSTSKFVEFVDISLLPNKQYISYVDIISRIESYTRNRIFRDSISFSDQIFLHKEIIRIFPEIIDIVEELQKQVSKTFSDDYTISDAFSLAWEKIINDSFTHEEYYYFNFAKRLSDTILSIEEVRKDFNKTISDDIKVSDINSWHLEKQLEDSTEVVDYSLLFFNKFISDSYNITDYGTLFHHNYTNTGTYNSENYVGQFFPFNK